MSQGNIYAEPRLVTDLEACDFYHTMEIPGYGQVEGKWDLRQGVQDYLGGVDFKDKRVLELGTASGFLCFHMESQGAEVVAYDLSAEESWDVVPFHDLDYQKLASERKEHIRKLNNGYWLSHRAFQSKAKVVYGSVYEIPEQIGMVDITTYGAILLHLRDPFLALQKGLRLTRETVIVTDWPPRLNVFDQLLRKLYFRVEFLSKLIKPSMQFLPDYRKGQPWESWWFLPPEIIVQFLGILGFEETQITYHKQTLGGRRITLYTVVGHRTKGLKR